MSSPSQPGLGSVSKISLLLGLGDDTRYQNPKLQTSKGRNPHFYIRPYIHNPSGKPRQERIPLGLCAEISKREAIKRKNAALEKINRRQMVVAAQINFGEFIDQWLKEYVFDGNNLSSATQTKYESHIRSRIRPYFGAMKMGEITTRVVDEWLASLSKAGLSYNSRSDLRNTLSGIFTKARKWGLWKELNPTMDAAVGKHREAREKRKLSGDELRAILATVPTEVALMCKLALCTLRFSEVRGLQERHLEFYENPTVGGSSDFPDGRLLPSHLGDVELCDRSSASMGARVGNLDMLRSNVHLLGSDGCNNFGTKTLAGVIHIRQRYYCGDIGECKTAKSKRDVPMGILAGELRAACQGQPERYLFEDWTYRKAQEALTAAAKKAGCYWIGFGWHQFRREAKTGLAATGLDPFQIMQMAGHGSVDMALLYTLYDRDAQKKAVENWQKRVM
jgi:hypothetical protein